MTPFDVAWSLLKAQEDTFMRIGDGGNFEPRRMPPMLPDGGYGDNPIRRADAYIGFESQGSDEFHGGDHIYFPPNARVAHPAIQGLMSRRGRPMYSRRSQVVAAPDPYSGVEMEPYTEMVRDYDLPTDPETGEWGRVAVTRYRDPSIAHSQFHPDGLVQRELAREEEEQMREQQKLFNVRTYDYPEFTP